MNKPRKEISLVARRINGYEALLNRIIDHKEDMGADNIDEIINDVEQELLKIASKLDSIQVSKSRENEPNELDSIRQASVGKEIEAIIDSFSYLDKLKGALIGRFAGCALGAPVEMLSFTGHNNLKAFAHDLNLEFPPTDYWKVVPNPYFLKYDVSLNFEFTKPFMTHLPADDDIIYTIVSLLVVEKYGRNFTVEDVAELWQELIPPSCTFTAELNTLNNILDGVSAIDAGDIDNYEQELIGGDIRCDGWAYMNPLDPLKASEYAFRDASLTHRRSGIYGAMYFAAVISLAFGSTDIFDTLKQGLNYVPTNSEFHKQVSWALEVSHKITNYQEAYDTVTKRFPNMNPAHTINNACLTIWGVLLGQDDFTKGISETVAMGYDNDCTAATVGSILGAYLGIKEIDEKWYKPWNDKVKTYLKGYPEFSIDDLVNRFRKLGINK